MSIGGETEAAARAARLTRVGLAVQLTATLAAGWAAYASSSFLAIAVAAHLFMGALAWAAGALLAAGRIGRAAAEAENARLAAAAEREGSRPLFLREPGTARPRNEAWLAGVLAVILSLVGGAGAAGLVQIGRTRPPGLAFGNLLGAAAALAASAFVLLLLRQFALALASQRVAAAGSPFAFATAGARRTSSSAIVALAGAVALALLHLSPKLPLDTAGYALPALEGLLAVELVLGLLLELYRPRRADDVPRPAFESRLLALVAEPGGVARSLAWAIDYQFGFKLSETWAYGLVERGLVPLLAFFALTFWSLSCVAIVPHGEQGILTRLGVTQRPVLEPGLHGKWPWPIDTLEGVAVARVRSLVLGAPDERDETIPAEMQGRPVVQWTRGHRQEEFFVLLPRPSVAGTASRDAPVDLLAARVTVDFVVSDALRFALGTTRPELLLKALGERELARLGSSHGLFELLTRGRGRTGEELRERIQARADASGLGVRILAVGLGELHPPREVAAAFHAETNALEEREARVLEGRAYAAKLRPAAEGEARSIVERGRSEAERKTVVASANARSFEAALTLDRAAPFVFRGTRRLRVLEDALGQGRKLVIPRGALPEAVDINFTDKLSTEELGLGEPAPAPSPSPAPPMEKERP